MHNLGTYSIVALLSAIVIFVMGVCLMVVSMPKGVALHNYRLSRQFLALAYIILAVISVAGVFWKSQLHEGVTVALFQALLFTYSLITLLNHTFMTWRRMLKQFLLIFAIVVLVVYNTFILSEPVLLLTYLSQFAYFALFAFYIWQFFREYRNYQRRADNFYSGNERQLLRWVMQIYVLVIVTGIFAGIIVENNIYFLIFIVVYTFVYVYMAVRYISYMKLFHRLSSVVVPVEVPVEDRGWEAKNEVIRHAVRRWIEQKRFLCADITLDTLAQELNTNRFYLSRHINSEYKQNFRSWINSLRIGEAKKLMESDHSLTVLDIVERIGVVSLSTFYRQFSALTGMTPQEYRNRQFERSHEERDA